MTIPSYFETNDLFKITCIFIWIIGVLGNVINLLVFNQKEMRQSAVNLIFWCLSLSDLLELFLLIPYEFSCEWCFLFDPSCNTDLLLTHDAIHKVFYWCSSYLLLAFHTSTVILNITLAILRFMVVQKPIHNKMSLSNRRSMQRMVIGSYVLSFVSCLSIPSTQVILRNDGEFQNLFYLQIFLRLGPLVVLIISCTMLIFAVIRALNNRKRTLNPDQIAKTGGAMKQINTLTIIIIFMFIVSDSVMIVDGLVWFKTYNAFFNYEIGENHYWLKNYNYFRKLIICVQLVAILVNCSYSIFCYLLFSSQYRKTLRLYVSNKYMCVLSRFKRGSSPADDVALQTVPAQDP